MKSGFVPILILGLVAAISVLGSVVYLKQKSSSITKQIPASSPKTTQEKVVEASPQIVYKRAESTWSKYFVKDEQEIPVDKFKAYYFDTSEPKKIVYSEVVDSININYAYSNGGKFSIDSENFGGYWIGLFDFLNEEKRAISVSQSWSESRIIIDGLIVDEGENQGNSGTFVYTFSPGRHKIEVEYINNWHTVQFSVNLKAPTATSTFSDISAALAPYLSDYKVHLWYSGVYEGSSFNNEIALTFRQSADPVILFLSSYGVVKWKIKNPSDVNLKAIILSSYSPGAEVTNLPENTTLFRLTYKELSNLYQLIPECYSVGAVFNCEGNDNGDFNSLSRFITSLTSGRRLDGFSGSYDASSLNVPEVILDDAKYAEIEAELQSIEKQEEEFNNQGLDDIFE